MKINPLRMLTLGLAGLVATGLIAFQQSAGASVDPSVLKRDEDNADVVLMDDDDDDDTNTRSRSRNTASDSSRTGGRSGRDDSRSVREVKDWTKDGPGTSKRDWSQNNTNDRSRNNTR
ncbi:hypothetical protein [Nocardioides stalactiti]|uniref:hypothetical protein n=1 Tax=Nocardioides stalactiti TaxID=2755356 RepID=UPI001603F9B1|nr:hypothetical protein [Nocardioides stalactiti]